MKTKSRIVRSGEVTPPDLELAIKRAEQELERKGATVLKIDRRVEQQIAHIMYEIADK